MWISSHWCQWYNCFSRFSKHLRWKHYLLMAYSTSYWTIYWSGIFKFFFRLQVRCLFCLRIYYWLHLLICLYFSLDFLTIYDGSSNSSLTFGQYCGDSIPQSRISSTNQMYIFFQSDGKDHHANEMAGFQINYRTYSKFCKVLMIEFIKISIQFYLHMICFTERTVSSNCYSLGQLEGENPIFLMSQMRERPASIIVNEIFDLDTAIMITGN